MQTVIAGVQNDWNSDSDMFSDNDNDPTYMPPGTQQASSDTDTVPDADSDDNEPRTIETNIENVSLHLLPSTSSAVAAPVVTDHTKDEQTPKRSRKRQRHPENWKRNKRSQSYNSGQNKTLKVGCHCRMGCGGKFADDDRQQLLSSFWGLKCQKRRRDFVVNHVERKAVTRHRTKQSVIKCKNSIVYRLPQVHGPQIQVCKTFFLNTLAISESVVKYNLNNKTGCTITPQKQRTAHNKTTPEQIELVKKHINSFPRVESHFCRKNTSREFLECGLNVKEMYRLYCDYAEKEGHKDKLVKEKIYRNIFNSDFNLSFHVRKKDQCDTCSKFNQKQNAKAITDDDTRAHEDHIRRKEQAREHKEIDKKPSDETVSAVFDLQQVMTCPKLNVGAAYYLRKLNVYNLTIYEFQTHQGICNTWTEAEHNKGTNEVASCLIKWLTEKDEEGYTKAVLYSDTCGSQNRNKFMCTALLWFLEKKAKHISVIQQKFYESGHSQNEGDSMHACIQNEFAKKDVYLPSGYNEAMKNAIKDKSKKRYKVNLMRNAVFDFDKLNRRIFKGNAFAGILSVHHIVYSKENSIKVFFANEIGGPLVERDFLQRGKTFQEADVSLVKPSILTRLMPPKSRIF